MELTQELLDIIYTFNSVGMKICRIIGRFYLVSHFDPASNNTRRHKLVGKDITEVLSRSSQFRAGNIDPMAINQLLMELGAKPDRTIEFSDSYEFIMFL